MASGKAPTRNLYNEISGEINARSDLMPKVFANEAEFRPEFSGLELSNLDQILNGTPGGTRSYNYTEPETGWRNTATGAFSLTPPRPASKYDPNAAASGQWVRDQNLAQRTGTQSYGASPGLMAITRSTDPATSALWDSLTANATNDVNMGAQLDPGLLRLAQQSVRQRQQGALGGTGTAGDFNEALGVSAFANDLRNQRRTFATNIASLNEGRRNDIIQRALGISGGAGPRLFGSTINANDVYSSNQNAQAANSASSAARTNAMIGAGLSVAAALI